MLKRFVQAMIAAFPPVSLRWEPLPAPRAADVPRPVWDNGINYDIPTFLRRQRRADGRRTARPALAARRLRGR